MRSGLAKEALTAKWLTHIACMLAYLLVLRQSLAPSGLELVRQTMLASVSPASASKYWDYRPVPPYLVLTQIAVGKRSQDHSVSLHRTS